MNREEILAYKRRLCVDKDMDTDARSLDILIRAHLEKIPFENLDIFDYGKTPDLSEEALFEKIIREKRGGVCFELNMLFLYLLESLGYHVYPVAARVLWNKSALAPLSHMCLVAETAEGRWYCDVGYGGPGPKGLLKLEAGEQKVAGDTFRSVVLEDGDLRIERLHHGEWKGLLQFADRPVKKIDFQVINFYCANNPVIMFTQKRVVNLCMPTGSKALMDMELTVHEDGAVRRITYRDEIELERGLEEEFGIPVSLEKSIRKGK